jgi:NADH dehydrogenase/NADH:ubiquinone oxidoreductase subunit G
MCLIEMTKSAKPIVSCSLNAHSTFAGNNKIYTNSPLVKKSRENIMEFLLLNHPLDCPICDQGGECDLQDQSLFFGLTRKRFYQQKRFVHNKYLGIIVKTIMSRCIHCTRCIRFATEIANIKELGILGRGSRSEIGTYIDTMLNSELSGNLIDICPVGALTSRQYPFLYRDWELKKTETIDPSDSFGVNVLAYLKDNTIVKMLPSFSPENPVFATPWISDKTRFIFEGMLSSITDIHEKTNYSWNNVLKQILINIYMFDHMIKHKLLRNTTLFLVDENTGIETFSILLLLTKQYPFFKIRRPLKTFFNLNLDFFLKINQIDDMHKLYKSNACLLIGADVRTESPYLNLKLKKRSTQGNFSTFSIGSKSNLTYPSFNIGSNIRTLTSLSEGNTSSGIIFKNVRKITSLINSELSQKYNTTGLFNIVRHLNEKYSNPSWNSFNLVNTSLNSLGLSYFQKVKNLSINDLSKITGIYVIGNTSRSRLIIENYIEHSFLIKLSENKNPYFFIEQTCTNQELYQNKYKNYYRLFSKTFFETSTSYITSNGLQKNVTKIMNLNNNTKEDWQILRKVYGLLSKISFVSMKNNLISISLKTLYLFKCFINFMFRTTQTLTDLAGYLNTFSQTYTFSEKKTPKTSFYLTQLKRWIKDFYTGGFEYYSRNSKTMINSSISMRKYATTFAFNSIIGNSQLVRLCINKRFNPFIT